jgi:hypothetical protein
MTVLELEKQEFFVVPYYQKVVRPAGEAGF